MKITAAPKGRGPLSQPVVGPLAAPNGSTTSSTRSAADDRDQLLDRLQNLRTILPVFAQELATARRHTAQLRRDNRRLLEEVHRLQRRRDERTRRAERAVHTA